MQVRFTHVPSMVRVAVLATLRDREVLDLATAAPIVELVGCHEPDGWRRLEEELPQDVLAVALLDELTPHGVYRAMALGQGVASSRWEPEHVADVVEARAVGHLVLPCAVVRTAMARLPVPLTGSEIGVLPHLAAGLTAAQVAARTHFSERHVRRLRSSIEQKTGSRDLTGVWQPTAAQG